MKCKKRIIVVDDDKAILEVIQIILTQDGYCVRVLESGEKIVDLSKIFKPDIVLLDLWMPAMDGVSVLKLIRSQSVLSHVPVVFVSAAKDIQEVANKHKVAAFLPKPFDMNELLRMVETKSL